MTVYFTRDHEWIQLDDENVKIGITQYAQEQLGDIVFVELPELGKQVSLGDLLVVIESVKAAGEIKSPVDGTVLEVNDSLNEKPELVNEDATGRGWLLRLAPSVGLDTDQWMSADDYEKFVSDLN